ncbi:MAG: pantoate--beta-alanine ligase [Gammaproteobacteria bacterium]|nr:pantoate--beta-alanine ligase [Pseudomonadales bacterium]MCP5345501.1 pantoate--beta-alanine ligase [Pseudomonadales bacterium]
MQSIDTLTGLKQVIREQRVSGRRIGLVPTMGNLHSGHLELIKAARLSADWVVCSIFVNPMQFGAGEDLDAYPRTLDADRERLETAGCDCLFHPAASEVYPQGLETQTIVSVPRLGLEHCGRSRPGHFDGVTTVVCKLFNLCQPDLAFFGLKDYQQYLIIQKMVADLQFPLEMIGVETVREADGLAMSSRNSYLTPDQRSQAPALYQTLMQVRTQIEAGNRQYGALEESAKQHLIAAGLTPDYVAICNGDTLLPARPTDSFLAILAAVFLGKTRLIDNIRLTLPD